jgi:glycosyltransferase involved in cell wall biosynthesis
MSLKKTIYVFTSSFPCDEQGEIYLWDELLYLANTFDAVYFLPQKGKVSIKPLPQNCFVIPSPIIIKQKMTLSIFLQAIKWVFSDFNLLIKKKLLSKLFIYNYSLFKQLIFKANYYSTIIKNGRSENVYLYAYWFSDFATIAALVKQNLLQTIAISRAHGYDVFENQTEYGFIPFRKLQFKYIDAVLSVSKAGANHLKKNNPTYEKKIKSSYLGTLNDTNQINPISEKFQIASCSIIRDVKRLHLMLDILKHIEIPVTWHVIGNGPDFENLQKLVTALPNHIEVVFYGLLSKQEIDLFYKTTAINLFISLSSSEGLPVSMMEAQSYGIPIMSTDVGGCNEICNDETGFLIEPYFDARNVSDRITEFSYSNKNTHEFHLKCKQYWATYFNADVNYKEFSSSINHLIHA